MILLLYISFCLPVPTMSAHLDVGYEQRYEKDQQYGNAKDEEERCPPRERFLGFAEFISHIDANFINNDII